MKSNIEILMHTAHETNKLLDAMKQAQIEILNELEARFPIGDDWEEYFETLKKLREELT